MKCTCPACGKKTALEADVGDFPSRCQRCGALLRARTDASAMSTARVAAGAHSAPPASRPARVRKGILAGLLISDSRAEEEPAAVERPPIPARREEYDTPRIIRGYRANDHTAPSPAGPAGAPEVQRPRRLLRPESLREIARASARQKALRRATLRGRHQILGFLGKMGFVAVAMLTLAALALEARLLLKPAAVRADTVTPSSRPDAR